jgi:hypothetical protein
MKARSVSGQWVGRYGDIEESHIRQVRLLNKASHVMVPPTWEMYRECDCFPNASQADGMVAEGVLNLFYTLGHVFPALDRRDTRKPVKSGSL